MAMNDKAQLHTLEGLGAAVLMTMTILLITQSSIIVSPQSETFMEVQLSQTAGDALTVLDVAPDTAIAYNLTECVASFNLSEPATLQSGGIPVLNEELETLLPGILFNVDLIHTNGINITVTPAVVNGRPIEEAITTRKLVTLSNSTVSCCGGTWNINDTQIKVVEVRLTAWKV